MCGGDGLLPGHPVVSTEHRAAPNVTRLYLGKWGVSQWVSPRLNFNLGLNAITWRIFFLGMACLLILNKTLISDL